MAVDRPKPRDIENFHGALTADGIKVELTFGVEITISGGLLLHFENISVNEKLWLLYNNWVRAEKYVAYYKLEGAGENGSSFKTDCFFIKSMGKNHNNSMVAFFKLLGSCSEAILIRKMKCSTTLPTLRVFIKGFKCFSGIEEDCRLGTVEAVGQTEIADIDNPSGYISVYCKEDQPDIYVWKSDAEKLLEHLRRILSFSAGTNLQAPMINFYHEDLIETKFRDCGSQYEGAMPINHFLNLEPIFKTAIGYYFKPLIEVKNIHLAIEWFSMGASYTEIRLINAMTALEMLIDSNLLPEDKRFISNGQFEKVRKAIRRVIRTALKDCIEIQIEQFDKKIGELNEKMTDINRRSFRDKLTIIARRWDVPMDGITDEALKAAINARNNVIHRGTYEHVRDGQNDLWDHFTLVREIVVRILLKSLGFEGEYISHYGGYHFAQFPPVINNSEQP